MDHKNFLLNINTIFLSFLNDEINIYSKKQLEKIYNIGFDEYINSNDEIRKFLNDEIKAKDLINILLSIINLNKDNLNKDLNSFLKNNLMNSDQISERINLILKKVSLNFKINDLSEPNLEKKSESFMDSMLISISEILSDKYFLKMCFYGKCEIIFMSRRKSSSYCNPKCQTRAKSYRAYHSNDSIKETKNIEKTETIENIIVTKLEPEKYEIPTEYDVDFGFFDDAETKNKLLGS
tara:strand:- start:373 stop:1083 length:711 start_codon:yes stop_codon:yes gene_type:complete